MVVHSPDDDSNKVFTVYTSVLYRGKHALPDDKKSGAQIFFNVTYSLLARRRKYICPLPAASEWAESQILFRPSLPSTVQ